MPRVVCCGGESILNHRSEVRCGSYRGAMDPMPCLGILPDLEDYSKLIQLNADCVTFLWSTFSQSQKEILFYLEVYTVMNGYMFLLNGL